MNISESARAVCPYYRIYRERQIQCESCVRRTRLVFVFRNPAESIRHKRAYCDSYDWEMCPYARMLNEVSDDEGEV